MAAVVSFQNADNLATDPSFINSSDRESVNLPGTNVSGVGWQGRPDAMPHGYPMK
jgi:hypothetical protein